MQKLGLERNPIQSQLSAIPLLGNLANDYSNTDKYNARNTAIKNLAQGKLTVNDINLLKEVFNLSVDKDGVRIK